MLFSFSVSAQQQGPSKLNLSGALFDSTGAPISQANVNFKVDIWDNSITCLLYSEQHTGVDLSSTKGAFNLQLGVGTGKVNNLESSSNFDAKIFQNPGAVAAFPGCASGLMLASGDDRVIRISYDLGSGFVAMTGDVPLVSVPYAMVAETLQGKAPTDLIQVHNDATNALTQTNAEYVFSGAKYPILKALVDGTSPQYMVTSPTTAVNFNGQQLTGVADPTSASQAATKNYDDSNLGGKTLDVTGVGAGVGGGKTLVWDQVQNKWVASLAGSLSSLTAGNGLLGGTVTSAGTISVDVGTSANKILQLNASAQISAVDGSLLSNVNAMKLQSKAISTAAPGVGQVLGWNSSSSQWEPTTPAAAITALTGDVVATGPGSVAATIQANAVTSAKINNVGVGVNQLLITDATTGSTVTYAVCTVNQILQWAGSGWACTNVSAVLGNSGVTVGNYGSSTQVPQLTVDAQGRVTALTNINIAFPVTSVAGRTGAVALLASDISGLGTAATKDVGVAPSNVVQLSGSAQLPSVDGSQLTNINATKIGTRTVSSTAPGVGTVLGWNNSTSQWEPTSATTGSVTSIISGAGLVAGTITANGTLNVDVGTLANKIVQLDGSARLPQVDGGLISNINAVKIQGTKISNAMPSGSQVLTYNSTTTQWEAQNAAAAGNAWVNGGNSFGATSSLGNLGTYSLNFITSGANRLTIDSAGNVGIGTTNPSVPLHVLGAVSIGTYANRIISGDFFIDNNGNNNIAVFQNDLNSATVGAELTLAHTRNVGPLSTNDVVSDIFAAGYNSAFGAVNVTDIRSTMTNVTSGSEAGTLQFLTMTGGAQTTAMTILGSGNVGIGTTSPGAILDLHGMGTGQSAMIVPRDTTANRPSAPVNGMIRYASDTDKFEVYQNSSWQNLIASTNGTVTSVIAGTGLSANTITANGTLNIDVGTLANKIVQLDGSARLPQVDGGLVTNINAAKLQGTQISATTPTGSQVLTYNGTTTRWEAQNVTAAINSWINGGNSFAATSSLGNLGAYSLNLITNGANRLTIDSLGNVGIGTTSPTASLSIHNPSTTGNTFEAFANIANGGGGLFIDQFGNTFFNGGLVATVNAGVPGLYTSTDFTIQTAVANKNILILPAAGGNVGIGTNTPAAILDINGTGTLQSAMIVPRDTVANRPTTPVNGMIRYASDSAKFEVYQNNSWQNMLGGAAGSLAFNLMTAATGTSSIDNTNYAQTWNWSTANTQAPLTMTANSLTTGSLLTVSTSSASLNSTAGVLNVANTGASTNGILARLQSNSSAGSGLTVLNNGNVGIGTATPGFALDVNGSGNFGSALSAYGGIISYNNALQAVAAGATVYSQFTASTISTSGNSQYVSNRARGTTFGTPLAASNNDVISTFDMRAYNGVQYEEAAFLQASVDGTNVTGAGNHPGGRFDFFVRGTGDTQQYYVSDIAMTIRTSGNVGVGTTTPASILDVYGTGTLQSAMIVPRDTTANRPSTPVNGMIRYASDTAKFEVYQGGAWQNMIASGSGSQSFTGDIVMSGPGTGLAVSNTETIGGALTVTGGATLNGGATLAGGALAMSSQNITGVGANLTGAGAITVAAGGTSQSLNLNASTSASVNVGNGNGTGLSVIDGGASTVNYVTIQGAPTGGTPTIAAAGADTNIALNFNSKGAANIRFNTAGATQFKVINNPTAVNYVQFMGSNSGVGPNISVAGSDTNIPFTIGSLGTGYISFNTGSGTEARFLDSGVTNSNWVTLQGNATGNAPILGVAGSDANINLTLAPKGSGSTVFNSGNVGVGTASPGALLQVGSTSTPTIDPSVVHTNLGTMTTWASNSALSFGLAATSPYPAWIQAHANNSDVSLPLALNPSGGNVGIGTTNPSATLNVVGNTTLAGTTLLSSASTTATDLQISNTDTGGVTWVLRSTGSAAGGGAGNLRFDQPAGSPHMIMTSTGNVGIGTASPSAKLDVSGHVANSGTAATVGTCGTSPTISGNDNRGSVTVGTGVVTSCTITFNAAYGTAPFCVATWNGSTPTTTGISIVATTSNLTVYFTASSPSAVFSYQCTQ